LPCCWPRAWLCSCLTAPAWARRYGVRPFSLLLAAIAVGLVSLIAWFTARTTVYTLTDKRVVMRIGIVLTMSLNLPLRRVEAADLKTTGRQGDISLRLLKPDHIAYLHLWPHARAWRLARPEPTLLCLPMPSCWWPAADRRLAPGHLGSGRQAGVRMAGRPTRPEHPPWPPIEGH
jgi:hypothetical protein